MRLVAFMFVAIAFLEACAGRYFPKLAHDQDPENDAFVENWYGEQLRALDEESLCCSDRGRDHIVRFTWLRSFHHPVVLRVDKGSGGHWVLSTKIGSGAGGYSPGHIATDKRRRLLESESAQLLALVDEKSGFWEMPTQEMESVTEDGSMIVRADGSQWIVEERDGKQYHFVDRWSPEEGQIHAIGTLLISFSGEHFEDIY